MYPRGRKSSSVEESDCVDRPPQWHPSESRANVGEEVEVNPLGSHILDATHECPGGTLQAAVWA